MADHSVSEEDIQRMAGLAHLALSEPEVSQMRKDVADMLDYVKRLDTLDTADTVPVTHGVDPEPVRRADAVIAPRGSEVGLANAPERLGDGFGVPQIIE